SATDRAAISERLAATGVPAAAVTLTDMAPIAALPLAVSADAAAKKRPTKQGNLQGKFRPAPGGVQIEFCGGQGCFLCTMSFVAYRGTTLGFVTNRHCTNVEGEVDGTHYWQALSRDGFVATEIADEPFFTGDPCPA